MVSGEGRVPEACLPVEARSAGAVACCAAAVERCAAVVAAQTWGHSVVASGEART